MYRHIYRLSLLYNGREFRLKWVVKWKPTPTTIEMFERKKDVVRWCLHVSYYNEGVF